MELDQEMVLLNKELFKESGRRMLAEGPKTPWRTCWTGL